MSRGSTADIDPDAWEIVAGKLYLNLNADIQGKWARDQMNNIHKADKHWPRLMKR